MSEKQAGINDPEVQEVVKMLQQLSDEELHRMFTGMSSVGGGFSLESVAGLAMGLEYSRRNMSPVTGKNFEDMKGPDGKIKLTESRTRRAIRKWLFEFATDSGVSHRMSTDDKVAGTLGDDREDQPSSLIPDEIPIVPLSQMGTQLSTAAPPVEDPDFIPGTIDELGKSIDLLSQVIPHEEIEWVYDQFKDIADQAVERGNKVNILDEYEPDEQLSSQIRPAQRSSQESAEATNESWNRWSNMLSRTLGESFRNKDFGRKWKQGDRLDLHREDEEGDGWQTQEDLEQMADDFGVDDLSELPGFDPTRHSATRTTADIVSGEFDGDAKLREIVNTGVYPKVRTISGLRKKIKAEIDPVVQMWFTAKPAFLWLQGFYDDTKQVDWNGQKISGPDIYKMALDAYIKQNSPKAKDNEETAKAKAEKSAAMADAIEDVDMYREAMAEIVMAPIIRRWVKEVKKGPKAGLDVSSSKSKNNLTMSQWILDEVLNSGFGASGTKRRAAKLEASMNAMNEFMAALAAAAEENKEMEIEEGDQDV